MIKTSDRPIYIILGTFGLTIIAVLIYLFFLIKTVPDNASIGIPFGFAVLTGLALFVESIVFAVVFFKRLRQIWFLLVPVFVITSVIPIYMFIHWYSDRPVKIPLAGQLPVTLEQYNIDSKIILQDYKTYDLDENSVNIYQDTITTTSVDTIIYNSDKTRFLAIIITVIKDTSKYKFGNAYRIGLKSSGTWEIGEPKGNILYSRFETIANLKNDLRQHFYKAYSINNSSDKPEIWNDEYIFSFTTPREKYSDRRKNAL
jgi:hypothetical protein